MWAGKSRERRPSCLISQQLLETGLWPINWETSGSRILHVKGFLRPTQKVFRSSEPELHAISLSPPSVGPLEEKVGNRLELVGTGKDFLNRTPISQTLRPTINK